MLCTLKVKMLKKSKVKEAEVDIIIRTKNEEEKIQECLEMINKQKTTKKYIVTIIDSGSTDSTLKIASKYDVNIYQIDPKDFNFGTSMQLGIELSKGIYCVFVSAHAIPVNNEWLEEMLRKFDNNKIAAVYGKQSYKNEATLLEKINLDSTFDNEERIQIWNESYKKYNDYKKEIFFSNANSCILTKIARKIPFSKIDASEDREWAMRILKKGYIIIYSNKH